jgi:hypothetical protein
VGIVTTGFVEYKIKGMWIVPAGVGDSPKRGWGLNPLGVGPCNLRGCGDCTKREWEHYPTSGEECPQRVGITVFYRGLGVYKTEFGECTKRGSGKCSSQVDKDST